MAYSFPSGSASQNLTANTPITAYPFTMACVCTIGATVPNDGCPLSISASGSTGNHFVFYVLSNQLRAYLDGSAHVTASGTISANTTIHCAATFTSTNWTVFLNGAGKAIGSHSKAFDAALDRTTVGMARWNGAGYYPFGNNGVAEVGFWNVELTDAEILSLSRGFTPDQIRPQSLQFYAPLVRDLQDVRGGRTITNVNGATVATHPRIIT